MGEIVNHKHFPRNGNSAIRTTHNCLWRWFWAGGVFFLCRMWWQPCWNEVECWKKLHFYQIYLTVLIKNLSGDIVKGIFHGSVNIFLVECSSQGLGLPRQWRDHPARMRLCPVFFEAAPTASPSALGSASVGVISQSLAGNGWIV